MTKDGQQDIASRLNDLVQDYGAICAVDEVAIWESLTAAFVCGMESGDNSILETAIRELLDECADGRPDPNSAQEASALAEHYRRGLMPLWETHTWDHETALWQQRSTQETS